MKITINLSEAEIKGLKDYLKEQSDNGKVTKQDIVSHIQNIATGVINAPQEASSFYIQKYEQ